MGDRVERDGDGIYIVCTNSSGKYFKFCDLTEKQKQELKEWSDKHESERLEKDFQDRMFQALKRGREDVDKYIDGQK